jgi:hypothetical protein
MSSHDCDTLMSTNKINSSPSSKSHLTAKQHHPLSSIMSLKDYLHTFDRHKSIDNCFLVPGADDSVHASLCYYDDDEIKKLTNHLFEITTKHYSETPQQQQQQEPQSRVDGSAEVTTTNGLTRSQEIDEDGRHNDPRRSLNQFSEIFEKFTKLADSGSVVSNVPWAVTKRTKFRINQTSSRDVPIVRTEKPARLKKQNAIDDANDMKLFDETVDRISNANRSGIMMRNTFADILDEKFANKSHHHMFQSHHVRHETFVNGNSVSFDCGQLGVEQRSINTIRALLHLHATTGTSVKQIQAQIESKSKL